MSLYIEQLYSDDNSTATVILPPRLGQSQVRPIKGLLTSGGLSFAGSNNYSSLQDASSGGVGQGVTGAIGSLASRGNTQSGGSGVVMSDTQNIGVDSTLKTWTSSSEFQISIQLTFIASRSKMQGGTIDLINRDAVIDQQSNQVTDGIGDKVFGSIDVRQPILELLSCVYPSIPAFDATVGGEKLSFMLLAPNGYKAIRSSETGGLPAGRGLCTVIIGKHFRARNMVLQSVSPTFSKEIQTNGTPIYATVDLTFVPYRILTYDEIKSFFISNPLSKNNDNLTDLINQENFQASKVAGLLNGDLTQNIAQSLADAGKFASNAVKDIFNQAKTFVTGVKSQLQAQLGNSVTQLQSSSNNGLKALNTQFDTESKKLDTLYNTNKEKLNNDYKNSVDKLTGSDLDEKAKLDTEYQNQVSELNKAYDSTKTTLNNKYQELKKITKKP